MVRQQSAVTAACFLLRKSLYQGHGLELPTEEVHSQVAPGNPMPHAGRPLITIRCRP